VPEQFYNDPEQFWNERLSDLKRAAERERAYQLNKDRQEHA
jgi:hypothetical protein